MSELFNLKQLADVEKEVTLIPALQEELQRLQNRKPKNTSKNSSYGRMNQLLAEVFGLEIPVGAISSLLSQIKSQLQSAFDILQTLRCSRLVCSDEIKCAGQ
jgi:hypothetical protein